ncbi:hypothetical protein TELCIR_14445 [Teladorsagia circumcincta]|uniref:Uncharacterized protein n=1 Tax=Teladorsagia circumcincta TaxID=45464 RepID=A0A2G9U109_TELCI|nr:hypothetical protein TELCIR_14445 [Teladorsagia circumcincta]
MIHLDGEDSRRAVRRERKDIRRTMCTGCLIFVLILAVAAGISVYTSMHTNPTYPLARLKRHEYTSVRIPDYDDQK